MTTMTDTPPADRYGRAAIFFHWATVLLVALAFASIESRVLFERGTAIRTGVKELHYVLGAAILLMTLARIASRLSRGGLPAIEPPLPAWQRLSSHAMHGLLYAMLVVLPVMGWVTVSALGDPMPVAFGLHIPPVMAPDKEFGKWLEDWHSFGGDVLYLLIIGHAVAALAHHYGRRDTTLTRMLPRR